MTKLLVGDPDCTFREIMTMFDDPSLTTLKMTWWSILATRLDIRHHHVQQWQNDLLLDKCTHIDVVILEVLKHWRMKNSKEATLGALYQAIPEDMPQVKDFIREKIRKKAKSWEHLDVDSQIFVMQTKIKFLGRKYSLKTLREMMSADKFIEIFYKAEMKEWFMKSFQNEEWDLGPNGIPNALPYYIPRKLTQNRRLNPAIFKQECSDIFLIEGIQHHHLTILARPGLTDVSSKQLKTLTRRFILLEDPEDCDKLAVVAKHPVHRIKHDNNQFYWLSSSGSCQLIRVFLLNDAEEIDETTLVIEHLSIFNNRPIAVCSSPGMGKSVLLANLAQEMIRVYPKRVIIYLEWRSVVPKLTSIEPNIKLEEIRQILVSSPLISLLGKKILLVLLQSSDLLFEIFLDGFDEIPMELLNLAKAFLKILLHVRNMRVYITSRPHMQHELENTLQVVSLNITPFNFENQAKFLCDFWQTNHNIKIPEKLSQFVNKVLDSLRATSDNNDSKTELAAIPLQCLMIAQIYQNDAKRYTTRDQFNFRATNSIYELYNEFMTSKFEKLEERERQLVKFFHWKEALVLLFPDNQDATHIVQELTRYMGTEIDPWEKVFTVGILEKTHNQLSFVHRTFAEYLLAEFIVEALFVNEEVDINISFKFIIDSVLMVDETTHGHSLDMDEVLSICNFIESSESWTTGKLSLQKLKAVLLSQCFDSHDSIVDDDLYQILFHWLFKMGSNASVNILGRALEFLGCDQLLDDLDKKVFRKDCVFLHEMVCMVVDSVLRKYESVLAFMELRNSEYGNVSFITDSNQLETKLSLCAELGYQSLTKRLMDFFHGTFISTRMCRKLLLGASNNDNVELFMHIWTVRKLFPKFAINDSPETFSLEDKMAKRLTLSISIEQGNYKLVEYLTNCTEDTINENNELWLGCFVNSWRDLQHVINNKVKILRLLKTLNQNYQMEKLELGYPAGVNLILLTSLYELCDYVPNEENVEYMATSVSNCCRSYLDFDILVNWLVSKHQTKLLTYIYKFSGCLLNLALGRSLLTPETLKLVHNKCPFNLGMIFAPSVICNKSDAIMKMIIELSSDVNVVDDTKNTLLHWAALCRKLNPIKYLLSISTNVNYRNTEGITPLYNVLHDREFSENYHLIHEIVSLLVANDADISVWSIAGISAVELAKANQEEMSIQRCTIEMLEKKFQANKGDSIEVFNSSDKIIKLDDISSFGLICADAILRKCFLTFVKNITQLSANVNISNYYNTSILHYAAGYGQKTAMEFLLSNGADVNAKDNDGDTPLHYIFDYDLRNMGEVLSSLNTNTQWVHECVEILIKYNADLSIKNNKGETSLDWALHQKDNLKIEDRTVNVLMERFQFDNEVD